MPFIIKLFCEWMCGGKKRKAKKTFTHTSMWSSWVPGWFGVLWTDREYLFAGNMLFFIWSSKRLDVSFRKRPYDKELWNIRKHTTHNNTVKFKCLWWHIASTAECRKKEKQEKNRWNHRKITNVRFTKGGVPIIHFHSSLCLINVDWQKNTTEQ